MPLFHSPASVLAFQLLTDGTTEYAPMAMRKTANRMSPGSRGCGVAKQMINPAIAVRYGIKTNLALCLVLSACTAIRTVCETFSSAGNRPMVAAGPTHIYGCRDVDWNGKQLRIC